MHRRTRTINFHLGSHLVNYMVINAATNKIVWKRNNIDLIIFFVGYSSVA